MHDIGAGYAIASGVSAADDGTGAGVAVVDIHNVFVLR